MIKKIFLQAFDDKLAALISKTLSKLKDLPEISFNVQSSQKLNLESDELQVILTSKLEEIEKSISKIPSIYVSHICSKSELSISFDKSKVYGIGVQRHFQNDLEFKNLLPLGSLRNNLKIAEPLIRDSELVIFDLNVLRRSEVNDLSFAGVSGLFSEDASQLFRYIGMSEKNKTIIIHNCQVNVVDLIAQLIWYLGESAASRFPDHPYFKDSVNEYVVDMKSLNKAISFYKSKVSGRWWVKIPEIAENKWRACNYEDYKKACDDEISNELLEIISIS